MLVWHCNIPSGQIGCIIFTNIFYILNGFQQSALFIISHVRKAPFKAQILFFLPIIHQGPIPTSTLTQYYIIRLLRRRHSCESLLWHPMETVFSSNPRPSSLSWPLAMASIFTRLNFLPIYRSHKTYPYT